MDVELTQYCAEILHDLHITARYCGTSEEERVKGSSKSLALKGNRGVFAGLEGEEAKQKQKEQSDDHKQNEKGNPFFTGEEKKDKQGQGSDGGKDLMVGGILTPAYEVGDIVLECEPYTYMKYYCEEDWEDVIAADTPGGDKSKPKPVREEDEGDEKITNCNYCLENGSTLGKAEIRSLKRCSLCKHAYYCSSVCQRRDWETVHRAECQVYRDKIFRRNLREVFGREGGMTNCSSGSSVNNGTSRSAAAIGLGDFMLLVRLLCRFGYEGRDVDLQGVISRRDVLDMWDGGGEFVWEWEEEQGEGKERGIMMGCDEEKALVNEITDNMVRLSKQQAFQTLELIQGTSLIQRILEIAEEGHPRFEFACVGDASGDIKSKSTRLQGLALSVILKLIVQMRQNNFEIDFLNNRGPKGRGVYPVAALLNHSCDPNCAIRYDADTRKLIIYAIKPIMRGDELVHAYTLPNGYREERRMDILLRSYGFVCKCERCEKTSLLKGNDTSVCCYPKDMQSRYFALVGDLDGLVRKDLENSLRIESLSLYCEMLTKWMPLFEHSVCILDKEILQSAMNLFHVARDVKCFYDCIVLGELIVFLLSITDQLYSETAGQFWLGLYEVYWEFLNDFVEDLKRGVCENGRIFRNDVELYAKRSLVDDLRQLIPEETAKKKHLCINERDGFELLDMAMKTTLFRENNCLYDIPMDFLWKGCVSIFDDVQRKDLSTSRILVGGVTCEQSFFVRNISSRMLKAPFLHQCAYDALNSDGSLERVKDMLSVYKKYMVRVIDRSITVYTVVRGPVFTKQIETYKEQANQSLLNAISKL
eukprot:Nk52_evm8s307 gene=Nk52_evmTU8s307